MNSDLPIIDLGPFLTTSTPGDAITSKQKETAEEIRQACMTHGFFYVTNHGIDSKLIKSMMSSTKDLFNLSSEKKASLSSKSNPLFRGYISTSDGLHTCNSKKKEEVGLDQKESFTLGAESQRIDPGKEATAASPMHGPNQWPDETHLPTFKSTMEEYWNAQIKLCRVIARGLALSLDLPTTFFDPYLTDPVAQMVLLRYPPPPQRMDKEACQTKHPGCGERKNFLRLLCFTSLYLLSLLSYSHSF